MKSFSGQRKYLQIAFAGKNHTKETAVGRNVEFAKS